MHRAGGLSLWPGYFDRDRVESWGELYSLGSPRPAFPCFVLVGASFNETSYLERMHSRDQEVERGL